MIRAVVIWANQVAFDLHWRSMWRSGHAAGRRVRRALHRHRWGHTRLGPLAGRALDEEIIERTLDSLCSKARALSVADLRRARDVLMDEAVEPKDVICGIYRQCRTAWCQEQQRYDLRGDRWVDDQTDRPGL